MVSDILTTKAHRFVGQGKMLCEVASFSSFRGLPKRLFCDGEVGDGSGVVNAICSRPEVADDVIYCEDAEMLQAYQSVKTRDTQVPRQMPRQ